MSQPMMTGLLPAVDGVRDEGIFKVYAPKYKTPYTANELRGIFEGRTPSRVVMPFDKFGSNQNPYQSCASHGLGNSFKRTIFARTGEIMDLQYHSAYANVNGGSDNGAALSSCMRVIEGAGMLLNGPGVSRDRIYKSQYASADWSKALKGHAMEARTKMDFLTGLADGLFGAIAVDANSAYMNWNGQGHTPFGGGIGNHCVCCDDAEWNSQTGDFTLSGPGSWGATWGAGGYWRQGWNALERPSQNHTFYLFEQDFDISNNIISTVQPPLVS